MRVSLGYKLMLSYIVLAIIPILVIGYYSYAYSVEAAQSKVTASVSSVSEVMATNINYKMREISIVINQLYNDQQFQQNIFNYRRGWEGYNDIKQYVQPRLYEIPLQVPQNIWLQIYIADTTFPEIRRTIPLTNPLGTSSFVDILQLERIVPTHWYQDYMHLDHDRGVWRQVENDAKYGNISYIQSLTSFAGGNFLGCIRVTTSMKALFNTFDEVSASPNSHLLIVDEHRNVLYENAGSAWASHWQEQMNGFTETKVDLAGVHWQLYYYVPQTLFRDTFDKIRNITLLLCSLLFVLLALLGWYISHRFSRRVERIITAFRKFQGGDFQQRIHDRSLDELAQIEHAFNDMARNLQVLIQEVYVTNVKKKEAELNTLQAQINPHFLYNTLSTISRMAKLGETDLLHEMILKLAKFYRLSLHNGDLFFSVDKEIQQIRAYLDIQRIRYSDEIEVMYHIEPDVLTCVTLKFLLQPFVENAILHARWENPLHILLLAYKQEQKLIFKIIDDGIGMSQDTTGETADAQSSKRKGYGIWNVDQRIKLQYGQEYGVTIFSDFGIGTEVMIVIPIELTTSPHDLLAS